MNQRGKAYCRAASDGVAENNCMRVTQHFSTRFPSLHSGLDATAATKLVQTLRALADAGKTIVAVIHQPSQHGKSV